MAAKEKPRVDVHSTIQVQSQQGGQIIGAYFAAPEIKAPDLKDVEAYLQKIIERSDSFAQSADEVTSLLLKLPFHVRAPGQIGGTREDFETALNRLFDSACRLDRIQRVVLLAEPGVGRTQALYHLLRATADESLQAFRDLTEGALIKDDQAESECPPNLLLPVYITLSDLRAGLPLLSLVRAAYNSYAPVEISLEQTDRLLVQYDCLILLDDLDELTFQGGVETVREFMQTYARERYTISSRLTSYHGQLGLADTLVLDELTSEEVQSVLGVDRYNALNEQVRKLAQNRAMLRRIIEMGKESDLPQSKGAIVKQMVLEILGLMGDKGVTLSLDAEAAENLLECLGYAMQCDGALSYSEHKLMEKVQAFLDDWHEPVHWRTVCNEFREIGVLKRRDDRRWTFSDRTKQSYFAASAVLFDRRRLDPVLEKASDFWWRETLEILAGLEQDPSDLIFRLVDENAVVAAHCLTLTGKKVKQSISEMLVDALIERMQTGTIKEREEVIMLIGHSGHPRGKQILLKALTQEINCRLVLTTVQALWLLAQKDPPKSLDKIEVDPDGSDPGKSFKALIDLRQAYDAVTTDDKVAIEKRLVSVLLDKDGKRNLRVRGIAAIELGFLSTELARKTLLDVWQLPTTSDRLASCVAEALTQIRHPEVEAAARKVYKSRRRGESWQLRRARAIYLLGWVGTHPETIQMLFQALNNDSAEIRSNAAQSIGRLEPQSARQVLEGRLQIEQDPAVLPELINALEIVGTQETLPLLQSFLTHESTLTRRAARRVIENIQARDQFI